MFRFRDFAWVSTGWKSKLEFVALSTMAGTPLPPSTFPSYWLLAPRQPAQQDTIISWDVPRVRLVAALSLAADGIAEESPTIYLSATGVQLALHVRKDTAEPSRTNFAVLIRTCNYAPQGMNQPLCTAANGLTVRCTITQQLSGGRQPAVIMSTLATLHENGWGKNRVCSAVMPLDLEPFLVDGCLKLQATLTLPPPAPPVQRHPPVAAQQ
jgi:hypothetical protein